MGGYPSVLVGSVSVCHFKINEQTYLRPRLRESTYHLGQFEINYSNYNLKLIIVHVEIKIVNKEAATKRCTLLLCTFEQSNVMLIRKGKQKEDNYYTRSSHSQRMFCNHGLEKQQTRRPKRSVSKRVRQAKKPTKSNPAMGQKDYFKSIWLDKIHRNKNMQLINKNRCKKK